MPRLMSFALTTRQVRRKIKTVTRRDGWVWFPEGGHLERVHFPTIKTYDSMATPTHGAAAGPKVAEIKLDEVKAALAEAVKEAEANDPKLLRQEIAKLKKQLADKPTPAADDKAIERAVAQATKWCAIEHAKEIKERDRIIDSLKGRMGKAATRLGELVPLLSVNGEATPQVRVVAENSLRTSPQPQAATSVATRVAKEPVKYERIYTHPHTSPAGDVKVNKTQQRILDALAWYESIGVREPTNLQVGAIALIDTTGGHFSNTVGPLSTGGFIERGEGALSLTDAGRAIARIPESIGTLDDYHEMLRSRVRKAKSASGKTVEILDAIIAAGGSELTTEEIGAAVGIDHTGGHFSNTIGPLGTLGLIERRSGKVKPTEILFPENVF